MHVIHDFLLLSNHNPIQQTLYLYLHFNNAIMLLDYLKQSGRNHLINYHFIAKFSPMAPFLMAIWFSILNFHTKIPSYVMILHTKLVIFDQNIQNVVSSFWICKYVLITIAMILEALFTHILSLLSKGKFLVK